MDNNLEQFKFKFTRMINLALGLAMIDGGLVVGIQIADFLLTYFFYLRAPANAMQNVFAMGHANIIISILGILNLAAIVQRITGIARGVKYTLAQCYLRSLRNVAALFVLYFLGGIVLVAVSLQLNKICSGLIPQIDMRVLLVHGLLLLALPYAMFTCASVVDQNKDPLKAIIGTYKFIRYKGDVLMLAAISLMYGVPTILMLAFSNLFAVQHVALLTSIWHLFCHILTLIVYIDNIDKEPVTNSDPNKPTKVVII